MQTQDTVTQLDQLMTVFSTFNTTTEKLTEAYHNLEEDVVRINHELDKKNEALQQKISEVDHVRSYLENIMHSMTTAVISVDLQHTVTLVNQCAEKLIQCSQEECEGHHICDILSIDGVDLNTIIPTGKDGKQSDEQEVILITPDSSRIIIGLTCSAIQTSQNKIIGYIILFRDLREIKSLQKKVRRSDRLASIGEMAARIAHEIRNPLGGIEGFASLLVRELETDLTKQNLAEYILDGARSVNHIVTNLLEYARPIHLKKELFSLRDALYDVFSNITVNKDRKSVDIVIPPIDKDLMLYADRVMVQQVLWNIMVNGIDAMYSAGTPVILRIDCSTVTINRSYSGHETLLYYTQSLTEPLKEFFLDQHDSTNAQSDVWYSVSIADCGQGITQNIGDKIFHPFFTTKENGTGLGLSTVYKIMEEHNGKIGIQSEQGKGTCFTLFFQGYR